MKTAVDFMGSGAVKPDKVSKFALRLSALGFKDYEAYLASLQWQAKRAEYAASDLPQLCRCCGDTNYLLHHLTYENLGAELLEDFLALCHKCHHRLHLIMKEKGKWAYKASTALKYLGSKLPVRKDYQPAVPVAPKIRSAACLVILTQIPLLSKEERSIVIAELSKIGYEANAWKREKRKAKIEAKRQRKLARELHQARMNAPSQVR